MLYYLIFTLINTFVIICIVDFILMGTFSFRFSLKCKKEEFLKLWNTAMIKMPLYANTFFVVEKNKETPQDKA